jgi:anti-anti-sigma regulatory factor
MTTDYASQWNLPMTQAVLDDFPLPLSIFRPDGLLIGSNIAGERFWGITREQSLGQVNAFRMAHAQDQQLEQVFARVMQGECVTTPFRKHTSAPSSGDAHTDAASAADTWIASTFFPLRDQQGEIQYVMSYTSDVSTHIHQIREIEAAQQEITHQRETIHTLAAPVIQVWDGILTVPVVGTIDAARATLITETLLEAIVRFQAEYVILDITGVPMVDNQVAQYFITTANACHLLGSTVVLVGIGSHVARTIVQLDTDLSGIVTRSNLQEGIMWAFERLGLVVRHKCAPGRLV